ncbi:protein SDA1, partial [Phenoliferia sp. Uapishka_3]
MAGAEAYRRPPPTSSGSSNRKARQQAAPDGFRLKTARGALITASLPSLQNLIKRSSESYAEEFTAQWARFGSQVKIVELGMGGGKKDEEELREVTGFVCQVSLILSVLWLLALAGASNFLLIPVLVTSPSQVAHLYPSLTAGLPQTLSKLLLSSAPATAAASLKSATNGAASTGISGGGVVLGPETRKTMMQGLVLLRRRDVITGVDLLKTLFPLLSMTTSPNLRSFILKTILGDIKNANLRAKNHKLNRLVQGLLFSMIDRGISAEAERLGTGVKASRRGDVKIVGAREAMWAVKIAAELWRKNVWRDSKTVAIVASACFHPDTKVQSAAIHFFLVTPDAKDEDADSSDEDNEGPDIKTVKHRQEINKKRKSSDRRAKREIKNANGRLRQAERDKKEPQINFSALQLLHDPQTFGEKLYGGLAKYDRSYTLDHKVLVMSLFGRVSSTHKLTVLSFYSYIIKYLTHHQLQITAILVALAQSVHDLTPPDELQPVVRKLAAEFVHGGVAAEVNAAGLNAITEVCRRQPWAIEPDLLQDLVEYKMSKDKGVMVASRGLLQLFREVNPGLLKRRDRGKVASMAGVDAEPLQFGEIRDSTTGIEGLDLLAKHLAEKKVEVNSDGEEIDAEEAEWKEWEVESSGSDSSSEGWNDVLSDAGSDFEIEDSDDDADEVEERRKKRRLDLEEKKKLKR